MSDEVIVIDDKKPKYVPKSKNWATIVYDEDNNIGQVINYLMSHFIRFAVSPIHDMDQYEDENLELGHHKGDIKKPHYHILMIFDCPKTRKQLEPITSDSPCVGLELIGNRKLYFEYLSHKNELFKYHYDEFAIQCFNCVRADFFGDVYLLNDIINDIMINDICSLLELISFYKVNHYDLPNILKVINKNAYLIKQILREKELHLF